MRLTSTQTFAGIGSVNYTVFADTTNTLFGKGAQIATAGCTQATVCPAFVTGPSPAAAPYSMTSVEAVTLPSNGVFVVGDLLFLGTRSLPSSESRRRGRVRGSRPAGRAG